MLTQDVNSSLPNQESILFRNTSDGVIALDRAGLLAKINPAAAAMLRCVPEQCIGKKPGAVFRDTPSLVDLLINDQRSVRKIALPSKRVALGIAEPERDGGRLALIHDITER